MAPGGVEPPRAASKAAALSAELRGPNGSVASATRAGSPQADLQRQSGGGDRAQAVGAARDSLGLLGSPGFEEHMGPFATCDGGIRPAAVDGEEIDRDAVRIAGRLRFALTRKAAGQRPRRSSTLGRVGFA